MGKRLVNFAALTGLFLSVPVSGQMMDMMQGGGMMGRSTTRRHFVMQNGVDPHYASKVNPLKHTAKNIADEKLLFGQNCAMCHGPTGLGDGEAGKNLDPPPPNITALSKMPMATDGYLYWSIAEGGVPLGTDMPPFKGNLKADEIWKIVCYLREF